MINAAASNVSAYKLCGFYFFRNPTLRPGFGLAQGGLRGNAAAICPDA